MTPNETPTSDSSEDAASDPGVQLRLFPLRTVLFPGMPLPLHIFEDRYKLMIGECVRDEVPFGVVLIRQGAEVGGPARVYPIGTVARIKPYSAGSWSSKGRSRAFCFLFPRLVQIDEYFNYAIHAGFGRER